MGLPATDMTSRELDILKQNICDRDKKLRQIAGLLATMEAEEEERSSGQEVLEDEMRGEIAKWKAQLTDEGQKMKVEEEPSNPHSGVAEMEYKEMVGNNMQGYCVCTIYKCSSDEAMIIHIMDGESFKRHLLHIVLHDWHQPLSQ